MNNVIKRHNIADDTLEALGIKSEYPKTFRNILCIIAIWTIGMIILIVIHAVWIYNDVGYWISLCTNICICFPIIVNSVVDVTFASFIKQVICFLKK